ncbi:signal recognition particle subunit SRP72-like [Oppia nitens]|uniref:signal recognition particle subunit SRP72-like n=1 Tax=Oppia nitens TaxID=1686743 RepID=UPI0023D9794F|nr:signal recognition particle subunit SRP72-like [Oppia nitens]
MSGKSGPNLTQLFIDLHRLDQSGEYEKAIKVTDKILNEEKDNQKAIECRIVCQIQLGLFEEAIKQINDCPNNNSDDLMYQKAYCEYRLNNVEEAINTLDLIKEQDFHVKELRAQALYRLERFKECYDFYVDLIKNSDDDYEDERQTNLAAVVGSLSINGDSNWTKSKPDIEEVTYELCYNKACFLLGAQRYEEALQMLNTAEDMCRKTLEEEGATEEEIDSELAIIRAQIAFCYQMQKKEETALRMYNQILKKKPDDVALLAVVSNNVVSINKDQNVFDSRKKMKSALSDLIESKLSHIQKQTIVFNNCLLLLHTNQNDLLRNQLKEIKTKYPQQTSKALLLEAALLCKEKKVSDAIKFLKQSISDKPGLYLEVSLILTQLYIKNGDIADACKVLNLLGDLTYKPAIISTLITLYLHLDDKKSATNLLTNAVNWFEKNMPQSSELFSLYRENARFLLETNQPKAAVDLLERLRKNNPKSPKIVSLLISAYSRFDPKKANEISKDLPPIESIVEEIDVQLLETSNWSLGVKYVKKMTKTETPNANQQSKTEKKKKKKKKIKLPKNYDPKVEPDPERWLPRYERSTYKKKKDKRGQYAIGKGTQGAVGGVVETKATTPKTSSTTVSSPQGPRQQRPTQKKKKTTKKK